MSLFGVRAIVHLNTRKQLDSTMPKRFHRLAALTSFVAEVLSATSRYAQAIRQHCAIENCSNYVRDGRTVRETRIRAPTWSARSIGEGGIWVEHLDRADFVTYRRFVSLVAAWPIGIRRLVFGALVQRLLVVLELGNQQGPTAASSASSRRTPDATRS
jgi:hypothetical protein